MSEIPGLYGPAADPALWGGEDAANPPMVFLPYVRVVPPEGQALSSELRRVVTESTGRIHSFVRGARDMFYSGRTEGQGASRFTSDDLDIDYRWAQGREVIRVYPKVSSTVKKSGAPCRWIIVELKHRHRGHSERVEREVARGVQDWDLIQVQGNITGPFVYPGAHSIFGTAPARYRVSWVASSADSGLTYNSDVPNTTVLYDTETNTYHSPTVDPLAGVGQITATSRPKGLRLLSGHNLITHAEFLSGPFKGASLGWWPEHPQRGLDGQEYDILNPPPGTTRWWWAQDRETELANPPAYMIYGYVGTPLTTYSRARWTPQYYSQSGISPTIIHEDRSTYIFLDVEKFKALKNPHIALRCSGWWTSLRNFDHAAGSINSFSSAGGPDAGSPGPEWFDGESLLFDYMWPQAEAWSSWNRVSIPVPAELLEVRVTRIWGLNGSPDKDVPPLATQQLEEYCWGGTGVPTGDFSEHTQVVWSHPLVSQQRTHNEPSLPDILPHGQEFGTLHYDCITGEFGWAPPR